MSTSLTQTRSYVVAGAPLAAIVLVTFGFERPRRWRPQVRLSVILLGSVVAAPVFFAAGIVASLLAGDLLVTAAGYSWPVDGIPTVPGAVIVGALVAAFAAIGVVRSDQPRAGAVVVDEMARDETALRPNGA